MEVEHTGPSGYETVEKHPITSTDSLLMTSQTSQSSLEAGQTRLLDSEVWLKFNDVSVIEVNWEEVKRESFGSNNKSNFSSNTSAYCLVYISAEAHDQREGSGKYMMDEWINEWINGWMNGLTDRQTNRWNHSDLLILLYFLY